MDVRPAPYPRHLGGYEGLVLLGRSQAAETDPSIADDLSDGMV